MTTTPHFTALDSSLKEISAHARFSIGKAIELRDNPPQPISDAQRADVTLYLLTRIKALLDEHVAAHSPDEQINSFSPGVIDIAPIEAAE